MITVTDWIPISDRLPDENEKTVGHGLCNVLVTRRHAGVLRVDKCYFANNKFVSEGIDITKYVVAWTPLPNPYRGA